MGEAAIHTVEASERDLLLDVLVLAFSADPCARYIWPKPADFLRGYRRLALGMGGQALDRGGGFITEGQDAAALWLPPGIESDSGALAALIEETVAPERQAVVGEVAGEMQHYHPKAPHWYLSMLGVDPARQGRGLGSALLKHTLSRVDDENAVAYLESSNMKNVPLYERHGFEVMGVIQPGDFPPLVPMLRPARR